MYEKVKYLSGKFIGNSIGCFILALLFIEGPSQKVLLGAIFLAFGTLWLFLGLRFKKKLKLKTPETENLMFSKNTYKITEVALRIALIISIVLSLKNYPYFNIVAILTGATYLFWLIKETLVIEKYLKESSNQPLQNIN
jgi:hypothetical protein